MDPTGSRCRDLFTADDVDRRIRLEHPTDRGDSKWPGIVLNPAKPDSDQARNLD